MRRREPPRPGHDRRLRRELEARRGSTGASGTDNSDPGGTRCLRPVRSRGPEPRHAEPGRASGLGSAASRLAAPAAPPATNPDASAATPSATTTADARPVTALFSPPEVALRVGQAGGLAVVLVGAKDVQSVEITLAWDPDLAEVTDVAAGSLLTLDGSALSAERAIESGHARVRFSRATGATGSGAVVAITMQGLKAGTGSIVVESLTLEPRRVVGSAGSTRAGPAGGGTMNEVGRRTAMSKSNLWLTAVASLAVVALAFVVATCASVPMTALGGHDHLPPVQPAVRGGERRTSVVTALLTEPAGTLAPDGTVVFFLTTLGRIDEQGKTRDGIARVNFVADSRSGTATVTAWSGGRLPAPAPSASATPAAFAPGSVHAAADLSAKALTGVAADPTNSGIGTTSITIDIGSALPAAIVVTANPPFLTTSRQSTITANVFDKHRQHGPARAGHLLGGSDGPDRAAAGGPGERWLAAVHRLERPGVRHAHHEGAGRNHVPKTVTVTATAVART